MSQMEPKPLPNDDMPSETRMQSTTERGRHGSSRIPLDVKFEILQVLFDSVDVSATEASAKSHEASDQATALSLHDSRFELRRWSLNLKILMRKADYPLDSLRIFGKLDGPLATTVLNVLEEIENDLRKLSADTTDNKLVFSEQFRAICGRVKSSIDRLLELQIALVEELTSRKDDVHNIISEECDLAKHRLPLVCFDGGGVCSYSGLLIFEALMDEVRSVLRESEGNAVAESIRPDDVFRYMFGASTGGWIAIMLGRLRMTEKQCKETFRTYTETIFRRSRWLYHVFGGLTKSTTSKYSGQTLARATKDVIRSVDRSPESLLRCRPDMFAAMPQFCRCGVGVVAYVEPAYVEPAYNTIAFLRPYIFRTYKNTSPGARNPGKADDCDIWDVALAATAAPRYFPAAKFNGKEYSDGGFGANNPSFEAFRELGRLHPGNPICLVSIGPGTDTAKTRFRSFGFRGIRFQREELKRNRGSEHVHGLMSIFAHCPEKVAYFRFNIPGLEDVPFDEWTFKRRKELPNAGKMHTLDFIERQTIQYLAEDETRTEIRACAQMVVDCYCPIYEGTGPDARWVGDSHPPLT